MLLWLLVSSALGVGAWGDFWRKTPARRMSQRLPSPAGNGSQLTDVPTVPTVVSRREWGAGAAGCSVRLHTPVDFLVTHHVPGLGCDSQATCEQQLRALQAHHVLHNGWCDVAYNFLVGDDGRVYEGVGWTVQGTHTPGYSNTSLGLAFFGSANGSSPSPAALQAAKDLIAYAVREGHLSPSYIQPLLLKEEACLGPRQRAMPSKDCPVIISRAAWGARETHCSKMDLPAKYVVIIHTAGTPCNTSADCRLRVRDTQGYHMDRMDFCDIGYQDAAPALSPCPDLAPSGAGPLPYLWCCPVSAVGTTTPCLSEASWWARTAACTKAWAGASRAPTRSGTTTSAWGWPSWATSQRSRPTPRRWGPPRP